MKPDWDKLSTEFKDSPSVQIVDVDCTAAGESVCSKVGVSGYPTIKYYLADEPSKPKDYQGGRTYDDLKKFTEKTFKAGCNIETKDNCTDAMKTDIDELTGKSLDDVKAFLKSRQDEIKKAKDERWDYIEESKKKIKELKKIEAVASGRKMIAQKMVDFLDPPKKEEEDKKEEL
jgi:hypothetical protein